MKVLINAYNTTSAGTSDVTNNLIDGIQQGKSDARFVILLPSPGPFERHKGHAPSGNIQFIFLPSSRGLLKFIVRIYAEFLLIPLLTLYLRPVSVFIAGNYAPLPLFGAKKIVLMHHPHLVESDLPDYLPSLSRLAERLRTAVFRLTLITTHTLIVQSEYMRTRFQEKYGAKKNMVVLPNPYSRSIGQALQERAAPRFPQNKIALYVSRYYPHKNHEFILAMAQRHAAALRDARLIIDVTIDPGVEAGARRFLNRVREMHLDDIIVNIGELPQKELVRYYQQSSCLFFPSRSETYGNPLIEAMAFGLPVVAPDAGYAHSACGDAGVYYVPEDADDAFAKLLKVCSDPTYWLSASEKSLLRFAKFPDSKAWSRKLLDLLLETS